jgi:hypothetical protein
VVAEKETTTGSTLTRLPEIKASSEAVPALADIEESSPTASASSASTADPLAVVIARRLDIADLHAESAAEDGTVRTSSPGREDLGSEPTSATASLATRFRRVLIFENTPTWGEGDRIPANVMRKRGRNAIKKRDQGENRVKVVK